MAKKSSQVSLVQYLEMGSILIQWYVTLMLVEYCLTCQAIKHSELIVWHGADLFLEALCREGDCSESLL